MQTQGASRWQAAMDRLGDWFPFGKAPLIILLLVLVSGGWLLCHPVTRVTATLRYWTFADTHYYAYLNAKPSFEAAHPGKTVDFQFVHAQAVTTRLRAAFWADLDVPDMERSRSVRRAAFSAAPPKTSALKTSGRASRPRASWTAWSRPASPRTPIAAASTACRTTCTR